MIRATQIRGLKTGSYGGIGYVERAETLEEIEFWGVYQEDEDGLMMWDSDHKTRESAERRENTLKGNLAGLPCKIYTLFGEVEAIASDPYKDWSGRDVVCLHDETKMVHMEVGLNLALRKFKEEEIPTFYYC